MLQNRHFNKGWQDAFRDRNEPPTDSIENLKAYYAGKHEALQHKYQKALASTEPLTNAKTDETNHAHQPFIIMPRIVAIATLALVSVNVFLQVTKPECRLQQAQQDFSIKHESTLPQE